MMNATKKTAVLARIKKMDQVCKDLIKVCYESDDGYSAACLDDARRAFELAIRRLQGESTLVD